MTNTLHRFGTAESFDDHRAETLLELYSRELAGDGNHRGPLDKRDRPGLR